MMKMASSRSLLTNIFPLYLLCIAFLIQTSHGTDPLNHVCSSFSAKIPPTSPYKSNLDKLLAILSTKTPPTGFSLTSYPTQPKSKDDAAYGLALCRGDVSSSDCRDCLVNASKEVRTLCPGNKAAIIWYDYCLLKYSNEEFFGQIDTQNKFTLVNVFSIGNNPELFKKKVKDLLAQLTDEATGGASREKLYAAREEKLDTFTKLYGLVQCTRDLSGKDCKNCLDEVVGEFPDCCDARQGGRVVAGSCNFRYEIYPFVNSS